LHLEGGAPAIDVLAPVNYLLDTQSYLKVMKLYHRRDIQSRKTGSFRSKVSACPEVRRLYA